MPTLTRIYILSGNITDNGVSLTGCQKLIWFQGVGIFFSHRIKVWESYEVDPYMQE